MSSIAGIFNLNKQPTESDVLRRMIDIQSHRGPDVFGYALFDILGGVSQASKEHVPEGFWKRNYDLALGHCRVATSDASPSGHQPMCSEDKNLWIIHSGEIYNHIEIRKELEGKGYRFRSNTDAEVILYSYQEWGPECLKRFNGAWAFAIWDSKRKRLFCARDRFGIKPFYYYHNDKLFIFASEIKALLLHPQVPRKVNSETVYDYLVSGAEEPPDTTFFEGIQQLNPAHSIILDEGGSFEIKRWWNVDLNFALGDLSGSQDKQYAAQLLALLEDSVKLRLRSETPVGIMLSGGMDSSTIACITNGLLHHDGVPEGSHIGSKLRTFSCCFEHEQWNETEFMEKVVAEIGAESHCSYPDADNAWEELPKLVWQLEQPCNGPQIYAHWTVFQKAAEEGAKVLLNGQGGDECFAGYPRRQVNFLSQILRRGKIPTFLKEARGASAFGQQKVAPLLLEATYLLLPPYLRFTARNTSHRVLGTDTTITNALNPSFARGFSRRKLDLDSYEKNSPGNLQETLYQCMFVSGIPQALRREDMTSAAFAIEVRFPFLDHRVVEYAFSLPTSQKIRNGWTKWILRQAMAGILPETIRWRRGKWYMSPEALWLERSRSQIRELFSRGVLGAEFIDPKCVDSLLDQRLSQVPQLWRLTNLELWLRTFFGDAKGKP